MATLNIELNLPENVTITGYHRLDGRDNGFQGSAHGIEVSWPMPDTCSCPNCKTVEPTRLGSTLELGKMRIVRDLDIQNEPSFFVYQSEYHRCSKCDHRQDILAPFKRRDTGYTFRFEMHVLHLLIGSTESDVARRLGISAETVRNIVKAQIRDAEMMKVDSQRKITSIGMDEISLKKRHKLYVTLLYDLTNPKEPRVLAVKPGRDESAAEACLNELTEEQRQQIKSYRVDMGSAYNSTCKRMLKIARRVIDRFHVAKLLGEAVDKVRRKITKAYKSKLTKPELKQFRSLMWEFRRDPASLSPIEKVKLETLFEKLPELGTLYKLRVRFKEIFDGTTERRTAELELAQWMSELVKAFPDMEGFAKTYGNWQEGILNYFLERETSGPVEGLNNKARVITKRAYGIKSATTLWRHLVLDLNMAASAVGHTIAEMRKMVATFRPIFSAACT